MHLWQKATKSRLPPQRSLQSAPIYHSVCAHGDDISGMSQLLCRLLKIQSDAGNGVQENAIFAQQIHQLPDYRAKAGDR